MVHTCKSPCHQSAVGYQGKLPNTHPNYLVLETENNLFLNIIDPLAPLFMPPLFTAFLAFANKHWGQGKKLLIHCNQGESRAPSLAMLFWQKELLLSPIHHTGQLGWSSRNYILGTSQVKELKLTFQETGRNLVVTFNKALKQGRAKAHRLAWRYNLIFQYLC